VKSATKNRLAIYTLAASILVSSILFSMNQSSAHTKNSRELKRITACYNFALMEIRNAIRSVSQGSTPYLKDISCF
jgi:hypothetical protein